MTTYLTEPFTGTNGAALPSSFTTSGLTGLQTTGSSGTIQSNKGRWAAGTVTGYGGKYASRYSGSNLADAEWAGTIVFNDTVDGHFENWIRADTTAIDGTGYAASIAVGTTSNVSLVRANSYTYTTLASVNKTINSASTYGWKHYCVGNTHKVKVWSGTEPGSYDITQTDSVVTAAGYGYIIAIGGGSGGFDFDIDDVVITDGTGTQVATFTGSITATGVLTKQTNKRFTGSITSTGALTAVKVVTRVFTGSITAVGVLKNSVIKTLTGSITTTGVLVKQTSKTFTGSITATGFFRKSFIRVFTGSITAHGSVVVANIGRVFGRPGRAALRFYKAAEAFVRVRRN